MKTRLLSLTLLAVALAGPASTFAAPESAPHPTVVTTSTAPDPAIEIRHLADLFQAGDLVGLAQGLMPRSTWEKARADFDKKRNKPTSDADRAHFAEKIQQITAVDAVDQLMGDIEPELAKARAQWPGMLLMVSGAAQVAVNSQDTKLSDEQREVLRNALPGVLRWAGATDFLSEASMRRTLTLFVDAARRSGITDIDQLKALPLEGVIERATPMLAAAKQAAQNYGLDLDAIAASLRVDVLERGQETARVRTTITLFGAPVWADHDLVLVEGHWYGKHTRVRLDDMADDAS